MGWIQYGGEIGLCFIFDRQFIILSEAITHPHLQVAGEPFRTVRVNVDQTHLILADFGIPHQAVETPESAMQVVVAFVTAELNLLPVQHERPPCNSVTISAYRCTEAGPTRLILLDGIVSQYDPDRFPLLVWYAYGGDGGAIVDDRHNHPIAIRQFKA